MTGLLDFILQTHFSNERKVNTFLGIQQTNYMLNIYISVNESQTQKKTPAINV